MDIDAGNALIQSIAPLARTTHRTGCVDGLGGFGALFDLKAVGYTDPVLVAATDGVGTKLALAIELAHHDSVGIDLVAMCVNDLVVQGAEPLFFLDYIACAALRGERETSLVAGMAEGCRQAGCALIGGETAEMPGLYRHGDYDLAGFALGAVEREHIINGHNITVGDRVLGLASQGVHANGFSLIRHILNESHTSLKDPVPFPGPLNESGQCLGDYLLTPTRIYVRSCLAALRQMTRGSIRALAHITGGGLMDNIPRVLPDGLGVRLDARTWPLPDFFAWLCREHKIAPTDMARTFNCGLGMIVIVDPDKTDAVTTHLQEQGETVFTVGHVEAAPDSGHRVIIEGQDVWL